MTKSEEKSSYIEKVAYVEFSIIFYLVGIYTLSFRGRSQIAYTIFTIFCFFTFGVIYLYWFVPTEKDSIVRASRWKHGFEYHGIKYTEYWQKPGKIIIFIFSDGQPCAVQFRRCRFLSVNGLEKEGEWHYPKRSMAITQIFYLMDTE